MYLNNFKIKLKKKVRVGRGIGSGLGKTCGKGHKGQRARSGYSLRRCFEGGQTPLNIRLPKFGFNSRKNMFNTYMPSSILNKFKEKEINISLLKTKGLIKKYIKSVKIVYTEDINRPIKLYGIKVTKKIKANIQ